jgi:TatD DNase family protein
VSPVFTDTHAHIQGDEFVPDLGAVLRRAREAGVERMILPAVDNETAHTALDIADAHPGIYTSAGYHPHEASRLDELALTEVDLLLGHARVVAVGEIGLDYFYYHSSREEQLTAIERQLALAERHALPVIIHCRDAWEDAASVLEPWARRVQPAFGDRPVGVMHYFSGTLEQACFYIDLGFVISVHTSVTHPKQSGLREVVTELPMESLVIETDSPYGAPQSYRGKRNEPAYVVEAARQIADQKGVTLDEVAAATTANAARLFRLPVPAGARGAAG